MDEEHLEHHIEYNKTMRFGRALLVDGEIIYCGYWKEEELQEFLDKHPEIRDHKKTKCTAPYR